MKKLLMLIGALIMSNAYGDETVTWCTDTNPDNCTISYCNANGNITKPATPSHPTDPNHYRFMGWAVAPQYNITTYDLSSSVSSYYPTAAGVSEIWTAGQYSVGSITGIARPSSTQCSATGQIADNPVSSTNGHCWCRVKVIVHNGSISNVPTLKWVCPYVTTGNTKHCAYFCAYAYNYYPSFRTALFGLN